MQLLKLPLLLTAKREVSFSVCIEKVTEVFRQAQFLRDYLQAAPL
jgi:hypothetical protein